MINKFNLLLDKFLIQVSESVMKNKYRIVGYIVLSILIVTFSFLPYLNLLFTINLIAFLLLALLFVIFRINWKIIIHICMLLFVVAFFLTITGFTSTSMILGDFIYGFLVIVAIEYFILI
ncbi:MAG: hypothetical protein AAB625_02060 [Patescibacteria group bacterium]